MKIKEIANIINEKGGKLYLVGGAVRDELLNRDIHDEDYCVVGLSENEFESLFENAYKRGKSFGVYDIDGKEFALARKEIKKGKGHKEFIIENNKNISIIEDLSRRDITINAIAKDVLTGQIIDPFNGRKDIKNKIIKATTEKFKEDPLRVYRVARFASQLEFKVEKNTIDMMNSIKSELVNLSAERVFIEFKKALSTKKPSIFFDILKQANVLDVHFKEIYDLIGKTQPKIYHPEGDSYNHTMLVLDKCANITDKLEIRFSALVHDLGKGITPIELLPHHYGHDKKGIELVKNLSNRLKIPNSWTKCGKVASKEHMLGGIFDQMSTKKQVDFITRVDKSILGLEGLKIVVLCDRWRKEDIPKITFDVIGKKCIASVKWEKIKQYYKNIKCEDIDKILRQERINWIKKNYKKD